MPERYTTAARVYDFLSLEWPVYRPGRLSGIPLLELAPDATVVDVGCGTGLNLPLLLEAIGPGGRVVGVDASADMLRMARRKVDRAGHAGVRLIRYDATRLAELRGEVAELQDKADAILFTYSLSLMQPWQAAWEGALTLARPGTRIVIVDLALPSGWARLLAPLARLACRLGGADITAHPWTHLTQDCVDVVHRSLRGGHIQVWAGTWPGEEPYRGSIASATDQRTDATTEQSGASRDR